MEPLVEGVKQEATVTTQYDLQALVRRCLQECEKSGHIEVQDEGLSLVITDREEVIKHIANTVVGELTELEIIRRIAPIMREIPRLEKDFQFLDDRARTSVAEGNLRIAKEEGTKDANNIQK